MKAQVWLALGIELAVFAALLFGAAGTLRWAAAWVFLAVFFGAAVAITRMLAKRDPALLDERMKMPFQQDQPVWDRALMSILSVLFIAWMIVMGLDAVRYRWSNLPVWIRAIGAPGVALAMWICSLAFRENTFLAPVVKIQAERGHRVISTGPYRVVRHPLYSGALLLFVATSLLMGSLWGLAVSGLLVCLMAFRAVMEERELRRKLEGYEEYAARVRYRLVPFVW